MRISKHIHSCLLVEDQNKSILIDPGNYTDQEHALDINSLSKLDYLLVTHEHPDHMYLPLIKQIVAKFPQVKIITNPSAAGLLWQEQVQAQSAGDEIVTTTDSPHEKLWDRGVPQNFVMTVLNKLTHPGDSLHFPSTAEVLALPVQAPWGSTMAAVEKAVSMKPKIVIPVHDWAWKDEFRKGMYQRLTESFKTEGIDFRALETGEVIEV